MGRLDVADERGVVVVLTGEVPVLYPQVALPDLGPSVVFLEPVHPVLEAFRVADLVPKVPVEVGVPGLLVDEAVPLLNYNFALKYIM